MQFLNSLFVEGNKNKARRVTADRVVIRLQQEVLAANWFEQSFITEARVKAFFGLSATAQQKLIQSALVATHGVAEAEEEFKTMVEQENAAAATIVRDKAN